MSMGFVIPYWSVWVQFCLFNGSYNRLGLPPNACRSLSKVRDLRVHYNAAVPHRLKDGPRVTRAGLTYLDSVHRFCGASINFFTVKLMIFLVVVVSLCFSSMTILQFFPLPCGGDSNVVGPPMHVPHTVHIKKKGIAVCRQACHHRYWRKRAQIPKSWRSLMHYKFVSCSASSATALSRSLNESQWSAWPLTTSAVVEVSAVSSLGPDVVVSTVIGVLLLASGVSPAVSCVVPCAISIASPAATDNAQQIITNKNSRTSNSGDKAHTLSIYFGEIILTI